MHTTKSGEQPPQLVRTQGTTSENVNCELLDKDGNLWFSIKGEGAYRYDGKSFKNFTEKDGLCSNQVGAIIQDRKGNILMGTTRGICLYDGHNFMKYPVPDTLSITRMLEDKDGNLWFGTWKNGIFRYDGKTLTNYLNSSKESYNLGNKNQFILDILQDRNGNLWFSSWNGGGVWRYDGQHFKNFLPPADYYKTNQDNRGFTNTQNPLNNSFVSSPDYITDDMIFSMTEDRSGNIWFATRNHGLCIYNGKTFRTIGRNEGFTSRGATAIVQDNTGFWITTSESGLWHYDGKAFKNFTEKDGLISNAVMKVLKDKSGNLWLGTKFLGLSRYDGKTFTTFSRHGK